MGGSYLNSSNLRLARVNLDLLRTYGFPRALVVFHLMSGANKSVERGRQR